MVDKLTKLVHFIATTTDVTATQLADRFFNEVVRHHGVPKVLVSDRDSRFTSLFWNALWKQLGTKLAMSTAFHPQTDGQTERANRTLEEMLRAYVDFDQKDWDRYLIHAEIACNNAPQTSTGESPFYLNYGQHPLLPLNMAVDTPSNNPAAADRIKIMKEAIDQAKINLHSAQQRQIHYANQNRREQLFKQGDKVLLSTSHLKLKVADQTPKLLSKFIGPFEITQVISPVAYRLQLPNSLSIHPVFHVSKLKSYQDGASAYPDRPTLQRPPPQVIGAEDEWEVERIVDQRIRRIGRGRRGVVEYLVLWKGYADYEKSWEPAHNLTHAQHAIQQFIAARSM